MSSEPERDRLPFEPQKNRKKPAKKPAEAKQSVPSRELTTATQGQAMAIPDIVSRRMVRRMAVLCGIPTFFGMTTFFASYWIVTHELFPLPNAVVVLVSMGWFGLGVLGLSYGVLSASWDEEVPGSTLGWTEFTTNFGRMTSAWRSTSNKS